MTGLELHYRRLLAVYPADHRTTYEAEMLGVLMAGASPGQRFPAIGEAFDLMRAGLVTRFGRFQQAERGSGWRDAAAVVGLLAAVVLTAVAGRRLFFGLQMIISYGDPMRSRGVDGLLLLDVALRSSAWLAVVLAAVFGARRTATGLAVAAALVEIVAAATWLPVEQFRFLRMSGSLVLIVLAITCLAVAVRGRSPVAVLGRRATVLTGAAAVVLVALGLVGALVPVGFRLDHPWADMYSVPVPPLSAAGVLLLAALWSVTPRVRRRISVLVAVALVVPLTQHPVLDALGVDAAPAVTPALLATGLIYLIGLPLATLAGGLAALRRRERSDVVDGRSGATR